MKIILATNNKNKVKEIKKILNIKGVKVLSLSDFPQKITVVEDGRTFEENAVKKATATAKKLKTITIADDSGLCVDALKGLPGVRSARYVKPPVTAERLCAKLLKEMDEVKPSERKAMFVCSVAIASISGKVRTVKGICRGIISDKMNGSRGFGYDPVFIPDGYNKTFAQMTTAQKNRLSHRGKAFRAARKMIKMMVAGHQ
ncbi:MAG: RdgB/HAM1 family non-canonical purine NTP pyrophosphatase [Candidatus Saganbacteria bacterium]|nr:RdgB/HAM1 family non-canonical purine NTP pyrophosphatase [Candidatus Saganbacteria bacterium]